MANVVQVEIIVDDKGSVTFRKAAKTAQESSKGIVSGLEKAGKAASNLGNKLTLGVTAPLAAVGALSVKSALQADRLRTSLEGLAGGADEASQYIQAIEDTSLGTISALDAMAISSKALSLRVVDNSEDMAKLTEIAITLGRAQGLSAKQAVDDLTTALGRQSPMILDNLGITLKISEAHRLYADQLGKSVEDLTETEKSQAFLNAALLKGAEVAADLGGVQEDAAAKAERFQATLDNARVTLGQGLIPVLEGALQAVTPLIDAFANMDEGTRDVVVQVGLFLVALGPAAKIIGTTTTAVATLTKAMQALKSAEAAGGAVKALGALKSISPATAGALGLVAVAAVGVGVAAKNLADEVNEGEKRVADTIDSWSDAIKEGDNLEGVMADLAKRANDTSKAFDKQGTFGNILADVFVNQKGIMQDVARETEEIARRNAVATGSYSDYIEAVNQFNNAITDQAARIDAVTVAQFEMQQFMADDEAVRQYTEALQANQEALLGTEEATDRVAEATGNRLRPSQMIAEDAGYRMVRSHIRGREAIEEQRAAIEAIDPTFDNFALKAVKGAHAEDLRSSAIERARAAEEAEIAAANAAAEALAAQALAAQNAAVEQGNLASRLKEATDAQIAQALIEQLDPEALGAAAYSDAVQNIQLAFGLADEKSIALAGNLGGLAEAINQNIIPTNQADEALQALIKDAADGDVNMAALTYQYQEQKQPVDTITKSTEDLESILGETADTSEKVTDKTDTLKKSYTDIQTPAANWAEKQDILGGSINDTVQPVITLTQEGEKLRQKMVDITSKDWVITVRTEVQGNIPGGIQQLESGGVVAGPPGSPQLIVAHGGEQVIPTTNYNLSITTTQPVNIPHEFGVMSAFSG